MIARDPSLIGTSLAYSPALDGLRAICILFTFCHHIKGMPGFINGTIGVDIFFVLSGFLITALVLGPSKPTLKSYYIRRCFRILPVYYLAYFLMVGGTLLIHVLGIGGPSMTQLEQIWLPSLLISRELVPEMIALFAYAWTVGIEEKFYLIWPLVVLTLATTRNLALFLGALVLSLFLLGYADQIRGYGGIAVGCLAGILLFRHGLYLALPAALVLLVAVYTALFWIDIPYENIFLAPAAAGLVASLYVHGNSALARWLAHPVLVTLGRWTFALYMFHLMVLFWVGFVLEQLDLRVWWIEFLIGYPLSVLVAAVIYRSYEKPLIDVGRRLAARTAG
ncbi:MAG: acyltransferase family protein [Rhodospirillaceae bacterium]